MSKHVFTVDKMGATLEDAPIQKERILQGDPQARSRMLSQSPDGTCNTMEWDCTAGTFLWYFSIDETVHIVEGQVNVTALNGQTRTLRAGDVAFFPHGTWMVWEVQTYVRKLAYCRQPAPAWLAPLMKARNTLVNMIKLRMPPRPVPMCARRQSVPAA